MVLIGLGPQGAVQVVVELVRGSMATMWARDALLVVLRTCVRFVEALIRLSLWLALTSVAIVSLVMMGGF